jgi:ElaB/YqjD/DUF883 family membrane-anchored ribosome-binding protein
MPAKDDKPAPSVEDLSQQIEALRADVAALSETLKGLAGARAKGAAEGMRAAGAAQVEDLQERLEVLMEEADRMARDRPVAAMGIAAGFGFLLGLLLGRR